MAAVILFVFAVVALIILGVDLIITPANVAPGTNALTGDGTADAGVTTTAGQPVYLDTTTNKLKLSDNNLAGAQSVTGVTLNGSSPGQPVKYQYSGQINLGATLVAGTIYVLSANTGKIAPAADLASGNTVCIIGVAISASLLQMNIFNSGAVV